MVAMTKVKLYGNSSGSLSGVSDRTEPISFGNSLAASPSPPTTPHFTACPCDRPGGEGLAERFGKCMAECYCDWRRILNICFKK